MNIHSGPFDAPEASPGETPRPTVEEAAAAARTLLLWSGADADGSGELARLLARAALAGFPAPSRAYPGSFRPDADYLAGLPDLQNASEGPALGARAEIQHVGVSNFRLPMRYATRAGGALQLETAVTGSVSLEAAKRGINMSRIMRSFYRHAEEPVSFAALEAILDSYLGDLESGDARLQLRLRYPLLRTSLRSRLEGYQYYDVAFEAAKSAEGVQRILHLDYVYASTCPCSLELSEHARRTRGQIAAPHSQRSVARVSAALEGQAPLCIEDLVDHCVAAIPTETQVMVKREDEQAFAELNAAHPIFVEDAVRLLCARLGSDPRVGDFRVAASHQESLHSHDAVSLLTVGETFRQASLDPRFFDTLRQVG